MITEKDVIQKQNFDNYKRNFDECQHQANCYYDYYKQDKHSRNNNLQRRWEQEKKEMALEKKLSEPREREEKIAKIIEEEKLAAEISELNRQRICKERMRQQLRLSNDDLKKLESQLRNAYLAKGLQAQKAEKEALRLQERVAAEKEKKALEESRYKEAEILKIEKAEDDKRKKELRDALQDQIIISHQKERFLYEEFLKDKRILDEIVRRIYEEHMEDMRIKMLKRERTRQDMENFHKAQEIWRERQRQEIEEENQQIIEFCKQRDKKMSDSRAERLAKEAERTEMNRRMCEELDNQLETRRKRERLLQDLYAVEKEEILVQKDKAEIEKKFRDRIKMRIGFNEQFMEREAQRRKYELDELAYKEEQMRFMAERDRLDQMSDEKRRRKMMDHRKAIQDILQQRRLERAIETTEKMKMREIEAENERKMQALINEERIHMLKEHAAGLIGFLPPFMLKESDLEHIPLPKTNK